MMTLLNFAKNYVKGVMVGVPFWGLGLIAVLISMTHTGIFDPSSVFTAANLCGLLIGETVFNVISLIKGELIDAVKTDYHTIKKIVGFFKSLKTAKEAE